MTTTTTTPRPYPKPQGDLSLPLTFLPRPNRRVLIVGTNKLAAARAFTVMESGFEVVLLGRKGEVGGEELGWRVDQGEVGFYEDVIGFGLGLEAGDDGMVGWEDEQDVDRWIGLLQSIPNLDLVIVTDTLFTPTSHPRSIPSSTSLFHASTSLHLPINTTDHPSLCTFTFPSIARFPGIGPKGRWSGLQVAVSTGGKGCRLAGRIKREIVARLGRETVGRAVDNVGVLRGRVRRVAAGSGVVVGTEQGQGQGQKRSGSCTRRMGVRPGGPLKRDPTQSHLHEIDPRSAGSSNPTTSTNSSTKKSLSTTTPTLIPRPSFNRSWTTETSGTTTTTTGAAGTGGGGGDDDDDVAYFSGLGALNSPVPQLDSPALSRRGSAYGFPLVGSGTTGSGSASGTVTPKLTTTALTALPLSPGITSIARSQEQDDMLEEEDNQLRRMRWISQISEYWSIEYLARMGEEEMDRCLEMWGATAAVAVAEVEGGKVGAGGGGAGAGAQGEVVKPGEGEGEMRGRSGVQAGGDTPVDSHHDLGLSISTTPRPPLPTSKRGKILLLGSGPGHPSLLTVAAHQALLTATLILSDKLVPSEILALIPRSTTLHIAKKFPGNAEGAQNEMMQLALEGALRGETVVRLKQGDPFVYGRGGEEVLFFRQHGFESIVVPGISSSIAGPLMMGIPVTQRGVADSMVLCTGVGRKGKAVQLPGYVRGRTLIVLMGVARIHQVLEVLTRTDLDEDAQARESMGWRDGDAFPAHLPIAIIERASSHDQRMVATTLDKIEDALERSGEQRPPGMMIIGWAALALEGEGEVTVLDDDEDTPDLVARDKARVARWLGGKDYILKDGLQDDWAQFLPPSATITEVE